MKRFPIIIGLLLFVGPFAYARDPSSRLAQPGFEDPTNAASVYATFVGSSTAQVIYRPDQNRDARRVQFYNPSQFYVLHVATWPVNTFTTPVNSTIPQTTYAIPVSSVNAGYSFDLAMKTTWYAVFETGSASAVVRVIEHWNDPTKQR